MSSTQRLSLALATATLLVAFCGCRRRPPAGFTESQASSNNLLTIHYPPGFTVEPIGTQALHLTRKLEGGRDEAIAFITLDQPASTDIHEFARIADLTTTKDLRANNQYIELRRTSTHCAGARAIEIEGSWVAEGGLRYTRRAFALMRNGHGFLISYSVAEPDALTEDPTLHKIVDATELH